MSWKWQQATDETKCVIAAGLSEDKSVWSQTGSLAPSSLGSCFDPAAPGRGKNVFDVCPVYLQSTIYTGDTGDPGPVKYNSYPRPNHRGRVMDDTQVW